MVNLVDSAITQMPEGKICLSAIPIPELQKVAIVLKDDRPETDWAEPLGLLSDPFPSNPPKAPFNGKLSPGLSLMVNKLLLELMNGSLEIVSPPLNDHSACYLQCSIPLATEAIDG
ncbi:MAG: sensor histidine kinase [Desertifilum sp. SIO1I2]|nr:sensor histidine kinase [Desertifilum sp. SIO1I2]